MVRLSRRPWRLLFGLLTLAATPAAPAAAAPVQVVASLPPAAWLAERLGGDRVAVLTLALPGESAETFQPTDAQVSAALRARLYLRLGLPFEEGPSFAALAAQPGLLVLDLRDGIELLAGDGHGPVAHAADPHHWLSPRRLRFQAARVAAALAGLDPEGRGRYEEAALVLDRELAALDAALAARFAPWRGRAFFVFHPEWTYFAADYGLVQVAIEKDGKEPTDRELTLLIAEARAAGARAVFVPPQIASRGAHALAEALGVPTVRLDALAADLPAALGRAAECLAAAFEGKEIPCAT